MNRPAAKQAVGIDFAVARHFRTQEAPMLYESRIYYTVPGRLPALNARFANHTMGFFNSTASACWASGPTKSASATA